MKAGESSSILEEWFTDVPNDFMRHGNCNGMDVNLFFPYKGESIREALQACNGAPASKTTEAKPVCPVRDQCLEYAMSLPQLCVGVWGGTSQKQRRMMRAEAEQARKQHTIIPSNEPDPVLAELVRLVSEVNRSAA